MHLVKLARMLANVHMMLMLMTFLAKPMFKVNKPLFISKQTMDVTWQKIPRLIKKYLHVTKYFMMWQNILPRHLIISTWKIYIKNIPWCDMEYVWRFLSCSPKKVCLFMFGRSLASVVVFNVVSTSISKRQISTREPLIIIPQIVKL